MSMKVGLLYSLHPDPDADFRKNRTPDIRPLEKPDRKYLENSGLRKNWTPNIRLLEKLKPNIEQVLKT